MCQGSVFGRRANQMLRRLPSLLVCRRIRRITLDKAFNDRHYKQLTSDYFLNFACINILYDFYY